MPCQLKYYKIVMGCVSAIDSSGRTIWIADAHRDGGPPVLSLWRDSRSRSKRQRRARDSFDDANRKSLVPRFYRYLPGPRPSWRCFKSDLTSWGKPWGIPPPLGSFAGSRSPTLTAFLVFFFLSCMFVTRPLQFANRCASDKRYN